MQLLLSHSQRTLAGEVKITGSKSESNRVLILQALYPQIGMNNLSESDDSHVLQEALRKGSGTIDVHHAGTAMRFLTAFFAAKEGSEVLLTGSARMKERPIKLLVDALKYLGADVEYAEKTGFPPLKIKGRKLVKNSVSVEAKISSQYISALMLIAPSLPEGLEINLMGQVTSTPYILMTLQLLQLAGIDGSFDGRKVIIKPKSGLAPRTINIESDWSSASYYYSLAALAERAELKLSNFRKNSFQGDSCIAEIYKQFGVTTRFEEDFIILEKRPGKKPRKVKEDLSGSPDIAQTIAVTCLALGIECELTGLHTLKIKETDRLVALKSEIEKFGAKVKITGDSLQLFATGKLKENVAVSTYNDHRMAMAFAPLGLKIPLTILDAGVVSKSYPAFWEDLKFLGFTAETPDE